ncbi:MAG: response regulator, partial [Paraclostridium sp.]
MYKLYLLDDEPFILEGLQYIIDWEELGFEIIGTASNGKDGFEDIIKSDVDLIITDIMMPQMTGLELISKLKEVNYDTNFIVLSAFQEFNYAKEAINMGAENYLIKPIDTDELEKTIKSVLEKLKKRDKESSNSKIINNEFMLKLICSEDNDSFVERLECKGVDTVSNHVCISIIETKDHCEIEKIFEKSDLYESLQYRYCVNLENQLLILSRKDEIEADILVQLKEDISRYSNDKVYISKGKYVNNFRMLNESFNTAKEMHEYKSVYPNISWIREYKETASINYNLDYIDIEVLKKILMDKDYNKTIIYVEDIFRKLKTDENLTPKQIKTKSIEIFLSVYNHFNDSKLMKGLESYLENVITSNNLEDIQTCFIDMIKYMQSKLEQTKESISPIILKLLGYIEQNYFDDLNLKEISDDYNINSIYLGQLFQKETGVLFSDYLNNFRINKA